MWYKFSQSIDNLQQQLPIDNADELTEDDELDFYYKGDEVKDEVLHNFMQNPKSKQHWDLIPAARLHKIWQDYNKFGFVRDESGINEISDLMINNVYKLYANTMFAGHTSFSPREEYEMNDYNWDEDQHYNDFGDHIEDENGALRISDYALEPLIKESKKLNFASTSEQKLQIIDRMLNIIHARSDIAGLFVEGGTKTLNFIFSNRD